ncbi:MAG: hypothetical protein WB660_29460, partial [Candidatus Sulfotelmatobacter sp.]
VLHNRSLPSRYDSWGTRHGRRGPDGRELLPTDNHNQQLYRSQSICPITGQRSLSRNSDTHTAIDPSYG